MNSLLSNSLSNIFNKWQEYKDVISNLTTHDFNNSINVHGLKGSLNSYFIADYCNTKKNKTLQNFQYNAAGYSSQTLKSKNNNIFSNGCENLLVVVPTERDADIIAADINAFFEKDTALVLVTDKISSPAVLAANFPTLKKRMVVEAFSYSDYLTLIEQGYRRVLYSCLATDIDDALVKHLVLHPLFKGRKIEWITMYVGAFDNPLFRLIDWCSNFKMALFTVNDYNEIPPAQRAKTGMIYTDKIKP